MTNIGKCDIDIYENGEPVGVVSGGDPALIDSFVRLVSGKTGVRMDWHYFGGRARVLAIGDIEMAKQGLLDYALMISVIDSKIEYKIGGKLMENNDLVRITKEEYMDLIESKKFLDALKAAGVDNWGGYDDAIEILEGFHKDE